MQGLREFFAGFATDAVQLHGDASAQDLYRRSETPTCVALLSAMLVSRLYVTD